MVGKIKMTLLVIALSIAPVSIARIVLAVHPFLVLFLTFHSLAPTHLIFHPYSGNEHIIQHNEHCSMWCDRAANLQA